MKEEQPLAPVEDDECDSSYYSRPSTTKSNSLFSSLYRVASTDEISNFLQQQSLRLTNGNRIDNGDSDCSMDGSLLSSFTRSTVPLQTPTTHGTSKLVTTTPSTYRKPITPYLSRSCFASITSTPVKLKPDHDLTELSWLNTFKVGSQIETAIKDEIQSNNSDQQQDEENKTTKLLAKLISELKQIDPRQIELTTTTTEDKPLVSYGVLIFLSLKAQTKSWCLSIKDLYEDIQEKYPYFKTAKRGWKNTIRDTLIQIPCFKKIKREAVPYHHRSVWTIDPYYRPLLTKAYASIPAQKTTTTDTSTHNGYEINSEEMHHIKSTLSDAASNRHDSTTTNESKCPVSILSNFAPKATVKSKELFPRLYEKFCEQTETDKQQADSNYVQSAAATLLMIRSRSSSIKQSVTENSTLIAAALKSSTPVIYTPFPSTDHTYGVCIVKEKRQKRISSPASSTGSIEYSDPSENLLKGKILTTLNNNSIEEDDEADSSKSIQKKTTPKQTPIVSHRQPIATRSKSKRSELKRKLRPTKISFVEPSPPTRKQKTRTKVRQHILTRSSQTAKVRRPDRPRVTPLVSNRISRRIIEQDLELLRQSTYQEPQPLDLTVRKKRPLLLINDLLKLSEVASSALEELEQQKQQLKHKNSEITNRQETDNDEVLDLSMTSTHLEHQ
ncbi:unnamed protein product [Didymodactylos carnosus]|uniref:Fork-head domain-containing protein n=1 Tax=Didymodactylos carnosus TaxID=1234261 RepID=A0A8S2DWI0_9BILA|nr:unnamed protein product [Didymodactylos carnosus]CAF3836122.1 unnamed protein product [Didymodactylos carnosus]